MTRESGNPFQELVLVVDDDPLVREGVAALATATGRQVIACSDVEGAAVVMEHRRVTHLVTDIRFSGPFSYEGLNLLRKAIRLNPACRVVVITGHATDQLRTFACASGAHAVLSKPFTFDELEAALGLPVSAADEGQPAFIGPLDVHMTQSGLDVAFQPIVSATAFSRVGFEALARPAGWPLGGPASLFDYAARCQRLGDLNLAAVRHALAAASALPSDAWIFVNVDPTVFDEKLISVLQQCCTEVSPSRVVLEVTERSAFVDEDKAVRVLERLSAAGFRYALDDHGSAFSHLSMLGRFAPSFLKISHEFGTGFERDHGRHRIISHITSLAHDFGAGVVVEGVETLDTAHAAREIGVDFLQGFYFGYPAAATLHSEDSCGPRPAVQPSERLAC